MKRKVLSIFLVLAMAISATAAFSFAAAEKDEISTYSTVLVSFATDQTESVILKQPPLLMLNSRKKLMNM